MAQLLSSNINGTITLTDQNPDSVPSPAAANLTIFADEHARRGMLAMKGATGLDTPLQPHIAHSKIGYWNPPGGGQTTAPLALGLNAPTANGNPTARGVATTNPLTRTARLGYVGLASTNFLAGYRNANNNYTTGTAQAGVGGFFYIHRFGISDATVPANPVMFIGLNTTTGVPANGAPNTTNSFGIGVAPGSNNMQLCYGGSTAQPRVDLGTTFRANTNDSIWELTLFSPQSTANASNTIIHYQVVKTNSAGSYSNTGTVEGGSAILPSNTTLLGLQNWRSPGGAATAVALDLISLYIETDF